MNVPPFSDCPVSSPGIYIHIPFCRSKCPYCSFVSYGCSGPPPLSYVQALHRQVATMAEHPWVRKQQFSSLFIGGGTPTVYKGELLGQLVRRCLSSFQFQGDPEISIEMNPNSASCEDLQVLREAGVNRLSIGVQSFSDHILQKIGRSHSGDLAAQAITLARKAGFDNINLDFMYGLPGQTLEEWQQTLEMALDFGPEHLALYELTIEPGTPFGKMLEKGELFLADQDELADMEETAVRQLGSSGYRRYEISNFSQPGRECRHNINYWQNGSYLGLGAGAVSCFDGLRMTSVEDYEMYEKCVQQNRYPFAEGEALSVTASLRESVVMGLRMRSGVSLGMLQEKYGVDPIRYYGNILDRFVAQDMLKVTGDMLSLTDKSYPLANQVLCELV